MSLLSNKNKKENKMNPEQEPSVLSEEKTKEMEARGHAQVEINDLFNNGRLANPSERAMDNDPKLRLIESDKARYDALEAAKGGALDGINDPAEKAALTERYQQEGQKGLESLVESLQKKVTTGPVNPEQLGTFVAEQQLGTDVNPEQLGTFVAEQQLGTDARGTVAMEQATEAATHGVESALTPEVPQTVQTPEISQ